MAHEPLTRKITWTEYRDGVARVIGYGHRTQKYWYDHTHTDRSIVLLCEVCGEVYGKMEIEGRKWNAQTYGQCHRHGEPAWEDVWHWASLGDNIDMYPDEILASIFLTMYKGKQ